MKVEPSQDRIWTVWQWVSEAYLRNGRKLDFPAHTDPTKTYQWRYVRAIARKFEEWGFDESTARQFLGVAVARAKSLGLMHKGLAAMHQGNLLNVAYDAMQQQAVTVDRRISLLRKTRDWLQQQSINEELAVTLLRRPHYDAPCNIVLWYKANKIQDLYLALSAACGKALATLSQRQDDQRLQLPSGPRLYMLRMDWLKDPDNTTQSRLILADDWRKMCP